jgi:hypothetical protein
VRCCVQKENGKLCDEPHIHGWLAERTDGTLTLVGGDCAINKFGADRRFKNDLNHYRNEKARLARIASLSEALANKDERLLALGAMRDEVKALQDRVRGITERLGETAQRHLRNMSKSRQYAVVINASKRRMGKDAKGRPKEEITTFQHTLGTLSGLELVSSGTFNTIFDAINAVVRAFDSAARLVAEPDLRRKSKEVDSVAGQLQRIDAILEDGRRVVGLGKHFFDNDFSLFCFLSTNTAERHVAARLAMAQVGRKELKILPAEWLSRHENFICQKLKVDSISIR